jgi:hypothetical protein
MLVIQPIRPPTSPPTSQPRSMSPSKTGGYDHTLWTESSYAKPEQVLRSVRDSERTRFGEISHSSERTHSMRDKSSGQSGPHACQHEGLREESMVDYRRKVKDGGVLTAPNMWQLRDLAQGCAASATPTRGLMLFAVLTPDAL